MFWDANIVMEVCKLLIPFHVASLITFVDNEFIINQDMQNNHFSRDDSSILIDESRQDWNRYNLDIKGKKK